MAENADDIELEDLDRERETQRANEEEETSFTDDRPGDESILIIDESNPVFTRVDGDDVRRNNEEMRNADRDLGRDIGVMRRHIIHDMKQFLKKGLGITINKGDGPNSTIIYDKVRFTTDKDNKINGATYKGKKILILRGGELRYSTDKTKAPLVNEFKELLRKADAEHRKTPTPIAEKRAGVDLPQNVMNNIIGDVNERIDSEIDRRFDEVSSSTEITANELRELRGTLYAREDPIEGIEGVEPNEERIKAIGIEMDHWKKESDKAKAEGKDNKALLYDAMRKAAELKADKIRLKLSQKLVSEEVVSMMEEATDNNDLTRLERFKKWARENVVGVSAIVISVAGIVTAAVMGARNTVKKGGKALGKFAKGVSKVFKKLGLLFSALGTLLSKMILAGSQGLLWLSQNLWVLFLMIAYLIYNEYRRK